MLRTQSRTFLLICDPEAQTSNAEDLNRLIASGWQVVNVKYEAPNGMLVSLTGEVDIPETNFAERQERVDGGLPN